jgi:23S rRNA pseudouridine2457 synthase
MYAKRKKPLEGQKPIYILFYKPDGVLTQFNSEGRESLNQYIQMKGVYSAGRLDFDSEGLLILTNDGVFIHGLTDPSTHLKKVYFVQIEGIITENALSELESGVIIKGYKTRPCDAQNMDEPILPERRKPINPHAPTSWIRLTLHEGKKRQIRHMTAAVGFPTLRLIRAAIGPIGINDLNPGQWRFLASDEVNLLYSLIKL